MYGYIESKVYEIPDNYVTFAGWLTLPIFTVMAFWIEILATY